MQIKFKFILISILLPFIANCQEFEVWGRIQNELNIGINEVQIENERTKAIIYSKCDGTFDIDAKLGDTLIFTNQYFKNHSQIVKNHQRLSIILNFDYESIRETFNDVMDKRYDNPTEEKKKIYIKGRSEVTMVVDNRFDLGIPSSINELNPKNIDTIIPLNKKLASTLLGDWGGNGAVWIYTKCRSD